MKALVLGLPGHFIRNVARALICFYDLIKCFLFIGVRKPLVDS